MNFEAVWKKVALYTLLLVAPGGCIALAGLAGVKIYRRIKAKKQGDEK